MKIIILGAGQVGSSLLTALASEKNDIVRILRERQRQAVAVALLERLRAKARIEILI